MCQMYAKSGRMCWGAAWGRVPSIEYISAAARSLLVWLIALLPIRSDPTRLDLRFFRFVSFPYGYIPQLFCSSSVRFDLIARRARARATCGSYSSATSTAAQADAPTPYNALTHARTCNMQQ